MAEIVPFNKPYMTGKELYTIAQAHFNSILAGDGPYTRLCHKRLEEMCDSGKVLLTHSCTAALEMQSLLLGIGKGDEVIMPSYTFVSTANAVVLRGGVPVFVDIRSDTLNIDETLIEDAISPRTRAIAPVHYAGVGCEMDAILEIARKHDLRVIEDAAQGFMSTYKGRPLGSIGDLGALSFHETKNVICGEGGALLVNDPEFALQAEIIREKGTDRSRFFRGEIDKYTWQDIGSSYLPGELVAAFLWAQLEEATTITAGRRASWDVYNRLFVDLEEGEYLKRPVVPAECEQNGHMYYILLHPRFDRQKILEGLKENGIHAVFHYVPLHTSPAGRKFCRTHGSLSVTTDCAARLIRLPLWYGIPESMQERTVDVLGSLLRNA